MSSFTLTPLRRRRGMRPSPPRAAVTCGRPDLGVTAKTVTGTSGKLDPGSTRVRAMPTMRRVGRSTTDAGITTRLAGTAMVMAFQTRAIVRPMGEWHTAIRTATGYEIRETETGTATAFQTAT